MFKKHLECSESYKAVTASAPIPLRRSTTASDWCVSFTPLLEMEKRVYPPWVLHKYNYGFHPLLWFVSLLSLLCVSACLIFLTVTQNFFV